MRLKDKVAVITGAGSGIGKATVIRFIQEGAFVVLADINENSINEVQTLYPDKTLAVKTDVSIALEVKGLIDRTITHFGKVDILINNAGIEFASTVTEIDPEDWNRVISINLNSVFLGAKYAIPHMIAQGHGTIINTASQLGLVGYPNFAVYNAAKGGVINLTRNMALDYARNHIRVNAVCPGPIDTPHIERQVASLVNEEKKKVYEDICKLVPMGRLGKASEIANVLLFLASEEASFVTGAIFVVDGGYTAQ